MATTSMLHVIHFLKVLICEIKLFQFALNRMEMTKIWHEYTYLRVLSVILANKSDQHACMTHAWYREVCNAV